jgi:hypothetical protein
MGHVVHSGASRAQNVDALFFMFVSDCYRFDKYHVKTRYAELIFLRLVGSVSHVEHSGACEARNIDTLFSCSAGTGTDLTNSAPGQVTSNLFFCF